MVKRRPVIYEISMSLAVLLFFSIHSVKRDDYILPALPGIAIFCASVFTLETSAASRQSCATCWLSGSSNRADIRHPLPLVLFLRPFTRVNLRSSDSAYYALFKNYRLGEPSLDFSLGTFWLSLSLSKLLVRPAARRSGIGGGIAFGLTALVLFPVLDHDDAAPFSRRSAA